jgi:hypothetical protein
VLVSVDDPRERVRLEELASQLGVARPIEGSRLRLVDAGCVFLDAQGGCRLHARFGAASKPRTCLQFPLVVLDTEHGPRAGIDPCCYHAHSQAPDAQPVLSGEVPARRVRFGAHESARERAVLEALGRDDASVAGVIGWLRDGAMGPADALPPGLASSWVYTARGAGLERFLHPDIAGVALRRALGGAFAGLATLHAHRPPAWTGLGEAAEAQVTAALRSLLFLRICSTAVPRVDRAAGLGLLGAVLLAWHDPEPSALGAALAGWFRLMRAPQFGAALTRAGWRGG